MRLKRFMMNEDDTIEKGMQTDEPEAKEQYTEEEITAHLSPIINALAKLREDGIDDESDEAIYRDLMDKKRKWEEVEPNKPAGKVAAKEEPAEEKPQEEEPAEEKPQEEEPKEEEPAEDEEEEDEA